MRGQACARRCLQGQYAPFAFEIRKEGCRRVGAIKYQQRFLPNIPQREHFLALRRIADPALDEGNVDVDRRIIEALQVLERTFGGKDLQIDAFAGEDVAVLHGIGLKSAAFGAAGNHQRVRRREAKEPVNSEHQDRSRANQADSSSYVAQAEQLFERRKQPFQYGAAPGLSPSSL